MARMFRLWGKKRGDRRTGSQLVAGLGEAFALHGEAGIIAADDDHFALCHGLVSLSLPAGHLAGSVSCWGP